MGEKFSKIIAVKSKPTILKKTGWTDEDYNVWIGLGAPVIDYLEAVRLHAPSTRRTSTAL